jgi:hypothetical protein
MADRRERLLRNASQRLSKITGREEDSFSPPSVTPPVPLMAEPLQRLHPDDSAPSPTASSENEAEMQPAIPTHILSDRSRWLITVAHTVMLVLMAWSAVLAYARNCRECRCFSILAATLSANECEEEVSLARYFLLGCFLSVEIPFVFLTVKGARQIGPVVLIRMLSGMCLYVSAYVVGAAFFQWYISSRL